MPRSTRNRNNSPPRELTFEEERELRASARLAREAELNRNDEHTSVNPVVAPDLRPGGVDGSETEEEAQVMLDDGSVLDAGDVHLEAELVPNDDAATDIMDGADIGNVGSLPSSLDGERSEMGHAGAAIEDPDATLVDDPVDGGEREEIQGATSGAVAPLAVALSRIPVQQQARIRTAVRSSRFPRAGRRHRKVIPIYRRHLTVAVDLCLTTKPHVCTALSVSVHTTRRMIPPLTHVGTCCIHRYSGTTFKEVCVPFLQQHTRPSVAISSEFARSRSCTRVAIVTRPSIATVTRPSIRRLARKCHTGVGFELTWPQPFNPESLHSFLHAKPILRTALKCM